MILLLFAVVFIVAVGATVLAYRNRPESSIESGISSFRREMRALAPPGQRRRAEADGFERPPSPDGDQSDDDPPTDPRRDGPVPGAD